MRNAYLYLALEAAPETVAALITSVHASRFDERRDDERFTFREAVAHLADHEAVALERFRVAIATDGGRVEGYDPTQRALEQGYAESDPAERAAVYRTRRAATVAYLKGLTPEQWERISDHSERGKSTVYDQANLAVAHDSYHVEHFSRFLTPA